MGASAMLAFPSFRKTIHDLDNVLCKLETQPSFSLERVLLGEGNTDQINDAELAQPMCTAIQIAIVDLFEQWKIEPVVAIGHSSGEIGAAVSLCPFLNSQSASTDSWNTDYPFSTLLGESLLRKPYWQLSTVDIR